MIEIDGRMGGGQVLRTALAMSCATGEAFRITGIRANRPRPGLMRQHLMCVKACQQMTGAAVKGMEMKSQSLEFEPGPVRVGDAALAIGSGGSTALVLQAMAPALLRALKKDEKVRVSVTGGTYCTGAPGPEFLEKSLAPALRAMGYRATFSHLKAGFWMSGGGELVLEAEGPFLPQRFEALEPARTVSISGRVIVCALAEDIPVRELAALKAALAGARGLEGAEIAIADEPETIKASGPGSATLLELRSTAGTSVFTSLARFGLASERVAQLAAEEAAAHAACGAPVERHLADQLLVAMTLAAGGAFLCARPSVHARSCAEVIRLFTGRPIRMEKAGPLWRVEVPAL